MALFLDLDGVLADLDRFYVSLFGTVPDRSRPDPPGFWSNIAAHGSFFADLPLMPDARELWDGVREYAPTILTGLPTSVPDAEAQKRAWVARMLGPDVPVIATLSAEKYRHGKPGDVLVDDWTKYRAKWERMGGIFVFHVNARSSVRAVREILG